MAKKSAASSEAVLRSILLVVSGVSDPTRNSGGWGYVTCDPNGVEQAGSGAAAQGSANRMALMAAIEGLKSLGPEHHLTPVRVVSASRYLVGGAKMSRKRDADADLWALLDTELKHRSVAWEWEPPDTLLYQSQAHDAARRALRQALKHSIPPQPGSR